MDLPSPLPPRPVAVLPKPAGWVEPDRRAIFNAMYNAMLDAQTGKDALVSAVRVRRSEVQVEESSPTGRAELAAGNLTKRVRRECDFLTATAFSRVGWSLSVKGRL